MDEKGFSISQAVGFGWQTVKSRLGFILVFHLAGIIIVFAPMILALSLKGQLLLKSLLFLSVISLGIVVFLGFLKASLKFSNSEAVTFSDLFSSSSLFFKFLGASILNTLVVGGLPALLFGLLISFFPAPFKPSPIDVARGLGPTVFFPILTAFTFLWVIIWNVKLNLFSFFVVDKNLGPVASLKASFRATKGVFWDEIGFWFVLGIINYIGLLCFVVGYFVTFALTLIASARVYRKLAVGS